MSISPLGIILTTYGQDSGSSLPPMENAAGTTAAPGSAAASDAQGTQAQPDLFSGLMPLLLIMVAVMVLMSVFGGRKEKKRKAKLMASMSANDSVQTIGGIIGRVIEVKPDRVVLEVDRSSNSRVTVSKQAVQQVLESTSTPTADENDSTE